MAKSIPNNPFAINTYHGAEYFCDRKEEIDKLIQLITNGNSVTLYSLRRLGKTGLIQHLFTQMPKEYKSVYVDIMNTNNLNDFLSTLASAIISQFSRNEGFGKKIWNFIISLRPTINFDPLTGMPQASFSIENKVAGQSIDSILNFLEKQNTPILIALDEFQQITGYQDKNIDGWLRARIQQLRSIQFVFSGSKQHLMLDLFNSPQRPFYRSTNMMKLEKINQLEYNSFIVTMFLKYKRYISPEIADEILTWTDLHTFYVQQLCNRIFSGSGKTVKEEDWKRQADLLLTEQQDFFFSMRELLTKNQWKLLLAIANHNKVEQPTGQKFIKEYGLPGSASILKSLKYLIDKGLVYKDYGTDGNAYYAVYDLYLRRWAENVNIN